jgi:hypothetical protein
VLSNLAVTRSAGVRNLFLATLAITVAIHLWTAQIGPGGLTPIFFKLFVFLDDQAAVCALVILLVAVFVPSAFPARRVLRWLGEHPLAVAAAAAIAMSAGSLWVYQDHPLALDEYAQYLQSQVFAEGHLTGRLPPALLDWLIPPGFQNYFFLVSKATGAVASSYWPSFALLLTPFTWLGIPWACNPLISAVSLILIHRLALQIFADRDAAGAAVLLTLASPVFFADGISYYAMSAHLLANTLFALLLLQPTGQRALLAGFVGSVALTLHNPVPHMLFALPWLIWIARRPEGFRLLSCLAAGYAPLCLMFGVGWFWFSSQMAHESLQPRRRQTACARLLPSSLCRRPSCCSRD